MDAKYDTLSSKVKSELQTVQNISLTTDGWTETKCNQSYLGLTVHFYRRTEMVAINIGCFPLDESHTSEYLGNQISSLCDEWHILRSSLNIAVADNANNIVKAIVDTFGKDIHIPCFAHSIQLVAQAAVDDTPLLRDIIDKIKQIVTFFKQSHKAGDELRRIQMEAGKTEGTVLKLKQQVDTRWNSTYLMIERFILLAPTISLILFNLRGSPTMLMKNEMDMLGEIVTLLKPIDQVTTDLCSNEVTCSKIIPMVNCLNAAFEKNEPNSEIEIVLQMNLRNKMRTRFHDLIRKYPLLVKATMLDPRFKKIHFNNALSVADTIKVLAREMSAGQSETSSSTLRNNLSSRQEREDCFWEDHDKRAVQHAPQCDNQDNMLTELRNYLNQSVLPRTTNPLKYWEEAQYSFPNVHRIALKYLSIPATSVSSERLFSKAALIDTDRKSRLNPERLNKLVFLSSLKEEGVLDKIVLETV